MTIHYNVSGADRKRLVQAMAEILDCQPKYLYAPSVAYEVESFSVDKDGNVSFDDSVGSEGVERLIGELAGRGFKSADAPEQHGSDQAINGLCIVLPRENMSEAAIDNLRKIVGSKASLIRKALGANRLDIQTDEEKVSFPWWDALPEPEETQAYTAFIAAVCGMAKGAKRVTATEKEVDSEKYAFRGFLLRLGFIGADSKEQRKHLLKNLSGSAAFPNKEKADAFSAAQKARRDAAKTAAMTFAVE